VGGEAVENKNEEHRAEAGMQACDADSGQQSVLRILCQYSRTKMMVMTLKCARCVTAGGNVIHDVYSLS